MLPVEPNMAMFFPGLDMGRRGKGRELQLEMGSIEKIALYVNPPQAATRFKAWKEW